MTKAILKQLAVAVVEGLASELHDAEAAVSGGPRKAKNQEYFIPFTQPRGAVMRIKHGKGKSANVLDEAKAFLMMEWWMVKDPSYPGTVGELAAHYELHPGWFLRTHKHLQAEHTLKSNRKKCGTTSQIQHHHHTPSYSTRCA